MRLSELFRLNGKSDEGFTLLEMVITLTVVSYCVLIFSFSTMQIKAMRETTRDDRQIEWHIFLGQLEYELNTAVDGEVSARKLSFRKKNLLTDKVEVISYERHFKVLQRQVNGAGYQPVLIKVNDVGFVKLDNSFKMEVVFENGETYTAHFPEIQKNVED